MPYFYRPVLFISALSFVFIVAPAMSDAAPAIPFSAAHPQYAAVLSTALAQEAAAEAAIQGSIDEDFDPEDFGLSEVGLLPNSPLYIFKAVRRGWSDAFTNNPGDKLENSLHFAAERLLEAEALAERGARESSIASALDGFRREVLRVRTRAEEAVATLGDTEEGRALAEKMIDESIKYQKLIGKIEKGTSGRAVSAAADAKAGAGETLGAAFAFVPQEEAAETLTEVLDAQRGSDFRDFKNVEVLKTVESSVPETARAAVRSATEHALTQLEDSLTSGAGSRSALGDYVRAVGGNEVRHLEIIQDLEVRPLSEDARAALLAAKEEVFSRTEARLATLPTEEKQALLGHLHEGTIEQVRVVKELEKNITAETLADVTDVAAAAKQGLAEKIENATADSGERNKLLESVERFHDAKSLSVLDEIAALIPPEQQSVFTALKQRAAAEIKNDISRARNAVQEKAFYQALGSDHPEELDVLQSFGVGEGIADGIRAATTEQIKARAGVIRDEARLEKYEEALRAAETAAGISVEELAAFFAKRRVSFGSRDTADAKIASAAALVAELSALTAALPLNLGYGDEGFDPSIRDAARLLSSAERRIASARAALTRSEFGIAYNESQEAEFAARDGISVARAYKSGRRVPETKPPVEIGGDTGGAWRLYNRYEFQKFCISYGGTLADALSCSYEDGGIFSVPKDSFPVLVPTEFRPTEKRIAEPQVLIVDPGKPRLLPNLDPSKEGRCAGPEEYACATGMFCVMPDLTAAFYLTEPYGVCTAQEEVEKRKDISCQAYFEGYVYDSAVGSCRKDSASGCRNPFVYKTQDECEIGIRAEVPPERDTARWVEHTWKFADGIESSMILDRTDSEYLRYIRNVETTCRLMPKQQFVWKPGAGNDNADNWKNFGIPDCSGQAFAPANCGNNICESGETIKNCSKDCSAGRTARDAYSCPGFAYERIGSRGERYCQLAARQACSTSYPQYLYESSYTSSQCPSNTGSTASTTAQFGNCGSNTSRTGCEANQDCDWYVPPQGSPYCSLAVRGSWTSHVWRFSDGGTETSSILSRTDREYSEFIASVDAQCKLITRNKFAWKSGAGNDASSNWQNFGIPDCTGTATNTGTTGGGGYAGDANSCPWFSYSQWDKNGRRYCQLNSEYKCDYAYPSYLVNGPNYKNTNCPSEPMPTGGTATTTTTGGGTSSMQKCFYPNASKNGVPVGYTVWCESDYINCHEGSPSGASISLTGVSLGTPSSCESGWTGGSGSCNNNNYCDPWESKAACPVECANGPGTYTTGTCNNNNYCDTWENASSCPSECSGGGGGGNTTCDSALTALLGTGCHQMSSDSSGNLIFCDGPMTKSAKRGDTTTTAGCPTTGGGGGSNTCDSALLTLLGDGCHSMSADSSGNTIFCDGPMTKSAKRGDTATTAGCTGPGGGTGGVSACSDGRDNDGDGAVDYPADTGCYSTYDSDEAYSGSGGSETPTIPTGVTASAPSTGNTVEIRWTDASTNETYFKIWRQANNSWAFLTQVPSAYNASTGTVVSYSDQNVPSGSVNYQIQACHATACSQDSSLASVWVAGGGGTVTSYCGDRICQSSESSASCPADCGATGGGGTTTSPACSDGRDNDGDGQTDYPADTGCYSATDVDEAYYPTDGGGGSTSTTCDSATTALLGTGCHSMGNAFFNSEMTRYVWPGGSAVLECSTGHIPGCSGGGSSTTSGSQCSDGIDNDSDSFIDANDPGCQNGGTSETYYGSSTTTCASGQYWNGTSCVSSSTTSCPSGQYWNGTSCVPSSGSSIWDAFQSWLGFKPRK